MDIQKQGRQLALAFINIDDLVFAKEVSGSGLNLLSFAGRSLVGSAVVGAGVATRAALFGAQVATKSALAVAAIAKGRIPGGTAAEQMAYDLDQRLGREGQAASFVAAQGVGIAKPDRRPPAEPIFGDPWLGKRIKPGATPGSVLVESAVDLTRIAALPLTVGTSTLASALGTSAAEQVTRSLWDAFSSIVDTVAPSPGGRGTTNTDRSERRAMLMLVALTPLVAAVRDIAGLGEMLSNPGTASGESIRALLNRAGERMDESLRALQSAVTSAIDVDAIEGWVRADEANRVAGGNGLPENCPEYVKHLETMVAAGPAGGGVLELARDTIFIYSTRALGREVALERMARLFGSAVRDRLADDCSLRGEFIDAKRDRDARLAALVAQLQSEGPARLHDARERAAERLASLSDGAADRLLERLMPQRIGDRIALLQRFIGMADTANALAGVTSQEPSRQRVMARFAQWMNATAADSRPEGVRYERA